MVVEGKPSGVACEDLDLFPGEGVRKVAMAGALVVVCVLVLVASPPGLVACTLVEIFQFWEVELVASRPVAFVLGVTSRRGEVYKLGSVASALGVACSLEEVCKQEELVACEREQVDCKLEPVAYALWVVACSLEEVCKQEELVACEWEQVVCKLEPVAFGNRHWRE
jgi:hypothetical protein